MTQKIKLFEKEGLPEALVTSLEETRRERKIAETAFRQASKTMEGCDTRFWELVHLAMPEYDAYYVQIDMEKGTIHAESEK